MITYSELYEALRKERYNEQLQVLSKNFINDVAEYFRDKKNFSEKVKCEKCGCGTWIFLIKNARGKVIRCNECPEQVSKIMRILAHKYFKIFNGEYE